MGIISRFKDIMASNINALLDKAEDPEKMIDQIMRNLSNDLVKVKDETAEVMAAEAKCKRDLDECNENVNKMQAYAEKALVAGNEEDAMKFLKEKNQLIVTQQTLQQTYDIAKDNALKMRQMHDKLARDIDELESRRETVKAKIKVAKAQEKLNMLNEKVADSATNLSAFDRMEDKADKMLDKANAVSDLTNSNEEEKISNLAQKYDSKTDLQIKTELDELKQKMGLV